MKRELAPGLFGDSFVPQNGQRMSSSVPDLSSLELTSLGAVAETKRLEKKIESLIVEFRDKTDNHQKTQHARYEDFVKKLGALESRFEALSQDLRGKYSSLSSKITERNLIDMKTQALIDKHTQLLRQFEARNAGLQKVIEEQEFQIMNYQAALEEARRDLARIKKL
jgi:chromosome segregation ATPase